MSATSGNTATHSARPRGQAVKRDVDNAEESDSEAGPSSSKKSRGGADKSTVECPEPSCKKRFKHAGLLYHRTHCHGQPLHPPGKGESPMETDPPCGGGKESGEGRPVERVFPKADDSKGREPEGPAGKGGEKGGSKPESSRLEEGLRTLSEAGQDGDKLKPAVSSGSEVVSGTTWTPTFVNALSCTPSTTLTSTTVSSKKRDGVGSVSVSLTVSRTGGEAGSSGGGGGGCFSGLPSTTSTTSTVQAPVISIPPVPCTSQPPSSHRPGGADPVSGGGPLPRAATSVSVGLCPVSGLPLPLQEPDQYRAPPKGEGPRLRADLVSEGKDTASGQARGERGGAGGDGLTRPPVVASSQVSTPCQAVPPRDNIPSIEVSTPVDPQHTSTPTSGHPSASRPRVERNVADQSSNSLQFPPTLLAPATSPLQVSVHGERRASGTSDDVQSPAYSDISDANDSSSQQVPDSHRKDAGSAGGKDENCNTPVKGDPGSARRAPFGMYLSGQSSAGSYAGSQASPGRLHVRVDKDGGRTEDSGTNTSVNESLKPPKDANDGMDSAAPKASAAAENGTGTAGPAQQLDPRQQQELMYQSQLVAQHQLAYQRQLAVQQQHQQQQQQLASRPELAAQHQQQLMYREQQQRLAFQQKYMDFCNNVRSLPPHLQYQYLSQAGLLAAPYAQFLQGHGDPQYRQFLERAFQEQGANQDVAHASAAGTPERSGTPKHKHGGSRPGSADQTGTAPEGVPGGARVANQGLQSVDRTADDKLLKVWGSDERVSKEQQALRETQSENRQVPKDSVEGKSDVDRGRLNMDSVRQEEEENRLLTYSQQNRDQRHSTEPRSTGTPGKPSEPKNFSSPTLSSVKEAKSLGVISARREDAKKEPTDANHKKFLPRTPDSKASGDDKRSGDSERKATPTDPVRSMPHAMLGMGLPVAPPVSPRYPSSPGQYMGYPPYPVLHPGFGPVVPASAAGMSRIPPIPPELQSVHHDHLRKMGYRLPHPHLDPAQGGPKEASRPSPRPLSREDKGGSDQPQGVFHKIHELAQEQPRPRSAGGSSPAPASSSSVAGGGGVRTGGGVSALMSGDKLRGSPPAHHASRVMDPAAFYRPGEPAFGELCLFVGWLLA